MVFLDTEFTDLLNPELLSLGMVTSGGHEFYVELDLRTAEGQERRDASSEFVHAGVLDLWGLVPGARCTYDEMGRRAGEWLLEVAAGSGNRVGVAYDYTSDFELLELALRDAGMWDPLKEVLLKVYVGSLTDTPGWAEEAEKCFDELRPRGLARHHALADALALRASYPTLRARLGLQPQDSKGEPSW